MTILNGKHHLFNKKYKYKSEARFELKTKKKIAQLKQKHYLKSLASFLYSLAILLWKQIIKYIFSVWGTFCPDGTFIDSAIYTLENIIIQQ